MINLIIYHPEMVNIDDINKLILELTKAGYQTYVIQHWNKNDRPLYIRYVKKD